MQVGGTSMTLSGFAAIAAALYAIACCECGATGVQIGKELPEGWRRRRTSMSQRYYCSNVVCWQYSWSRSREEWASA